MVVANFDNNDFTNVNIYWISLNLMYPMDELWTTGYVKYVVPYLSGGSLGNARTVPGCTYRPRVSLDSFVHDVYVGSSCRQRTVRMRPGHSCPWH